jgi:DNA repair photolyase
VVIGAATDPYQPAEGRYRLTRGCIAQLGASRTPISIITRGPLVVRDIDVLTDAAHRAPVEIAVSVATLDASMSARLEPGVAPPPQRLRTIRLLTDAGLRAGLALAPVLPGLTDAPASLAALMRAARDAGATHVWWNLLNLRPGTREHFLGVLGREWPDALAAYERRYPPGGSGYLAAGVAEPIGRRLTAVRAGSGIRDRRGRPIEPEAPPEQLHMAI